MSAYTFFAVDKILANELLLSIFEWTESSTIHYKAVLCKSDLFSVVVE